MSFPPHHTDSTSSAKPYIKQNKTKILNWTVNTQEGCYLGNHSVV